MNGNSIWDDFNRNFLRQDNMINQLIIVNVIVFVLINLIYLVLWAIGADQKISETIIRFLAVPANLETLLFQPWTLITYMFLHEQIFHILFNMLWLYWIGKILREYLGNKKILPIYILGGLFGAILYIIVYNLLPVLNPAVK